MRTLGIALLMLLAALPALAQDDVTLRAALYLTGAAGEDELDGRLLEELEGWRSRPLPINRASPARLRESGLLSPYQIAALAEYRRRSGDILSLAELALVDGFGEEAVSVLGPFLSLDSERAPGAPPDTTLRVRQSFLLRATPKDVGGKYRLTAGRLEGAAAYKEKDGTFYALWRTRRGKVLAGDYNVRYGQGLAFWSAFQLAGLSTPEAFSKRGNGITPSWSFSGAGTRRGLAWDAVFGPVQVALFGAFDGSVGGGARWLGRRGEAGLTLARDRLSLDAKYGWKGVTLFGEAAWKNGSPAGVGGFLAPLGEHFRGAFLVRAVPSAFTGKKYGEYGLALGGGYRSDDRNRTASLTVDTALLPVPRQDPGRLQVKATGLFTWKMMDTWSWEPRINVRWRNYDAPRTDARSDLSWNRGEWTVKNRVNLLFSEGCGFLTYLEGGWKPSGGTVWLRAVAFATPSWQTRIYCYEHDAPGNFTVPALYGKGVLLSAYGGVKRRWGQWSLKAYLRASYQWQKEKPGKAGLKLQLAADR